MEKQYIVKKVLSSLKEARAQEISLNLLESAIEDIGKEKFLNNLKKFIDEKFGNEFKNSMEKEEYLKTPVTRDEISKWLKDNSILSNLFKRLLS